MLNIDKVKKNLAEANNEDLAIILNYGVHRGGDVLAGEILGQARVNYCTFQMNAGDYSECRNVSCKNCTMRWLMKEEDSNAKVHD